MPQHTCTYWLKPNHRSIMIYDNCGSTGLRHTAVALLQRAWLNETGTYFSDMLPPTTLKVKTEASSAILPRCSHVRTGCASNHGIAVHRLVQRQQHTMCQNVKNTGCRKPYPDSR